MRICDCTVRQLALAMASAFLAPACASAADLAPRTYAQEIQLAFRSADEAAQATLKPLPVLNDKPWALTARWDDNHLGNLQMHDVMAKHGLKGTFYLTQSDEKNRFGEEYVGKLLAGGFSIGGHSQTHAKLTELKPADLFYEVMANRVERESQANMPLVSFAFPYGLYEVKEDPTAIAKITQTLKRSGYHHVTYHTFRKNNPAVNPGDFSSCLQVMPGDHDVDAAKFQQNLDKIIRFESAYKEVSHNITLATHARQAGKAWDDLDQLFASLVKQQDWWLCNQNEYAAYERQVQHTKSQRVSRQGTTATFLLTRPVPAELGASVPLTVEVVGGSPTEIRGDVKHEARVASGRTLINLAHSPTQVVPASIDFIDNKTNAPAATPPQSREIAGIGAWLTIDPAGNKAALSLANTGSMALEDLSITLRLPLCHEQGLQRLAPGKLAAGEKRNEVFDLGAASADTTARDGRRYYVAEIDFRRGTDAFRLYATATIDSATAVTVAPPAAQPAPVAQPAPAASPAPLARSADKSLVPFVIPTDIEPTFALRGSAISADSPRVTIREGHFYGPAGRLRIWGVNLSWGACFPSHQDAERIARRLEAFGVNSVRFHHMDYEYERFPKSIWDKDDPTRLSAEALDRLDYFIDQLARRGIYSNLNLHVSRIHSRHLGLAETKAFAPYDKVVDLFTPQLIEAQKSYARQLLTHMNHYRGKTYAQDPAVAFVEINNEDSFFMGGIQEKLARMPAFYSQQLAGLYNQWLMKRYGSRVQLSAAWNASEGNAPIPSNPTLGKSQLLTAEGAQATASATPEGGHRVEISRVGSAAWHVEYFVNDVPFNRAYSYSVSFRAKADAPRQVTLAIREAQSPWRSVGLRQNISLTNQWKEYRADFRPTLDEPKSRISILCGQHAAGFEIADMKVSVARPTGLADNEDPAAGTVALTLANESAARTHDRLRFCAELEKQYYDRMKRFVSADLGCTALMTGTSVYGVLGLWAQSGMDYVDAHNYWAHPQFPGASFDQKNWSVDQASVADSLMQHTLVQNAALRLADRPFTVSEYNHAAPNDYQSETIPTIATIAAAQDWDGVWIFSYSGALDGWDAAAFENHFDVQSNPAKWAFMPAGAKLFRDGGFKPLASGASWPLATSADPLPELVRMQAAHGVNAMNALRELQGVTAESLLSRRLAVSFGGGRKVLPTVSDATTIQFADGRFLAQGERGTVVMQSPKANSGVLPAGKAGSIMAAALDDRPLAESNSALVVACGRCENVGMGFSADRRTVGTQWGQGPVHVEPLPATLPWPASTAQVTSLKPDGRPDARPSQSRQDAGSQGLALPVDSNTIWYLVTTRP